MSDAEAPTALRATGRRTVPSLSASQIQHKRDLDRKAQRALRQRTKLRIQELENDLTRFKASLSQREQTMLEEIQQLRDQNRQLRSSLQSIGHFALDGILCMEETSSTRGAAAEGIAQKGLDPTMSNSLQLDAAPSQSELAPEVSSRPNSDDTYPANSEAATPPTIDPVQRHDDRRSHHDPLSPVGSIQNTFARHSMPRGFPSDSATSIGLVLPNHTAGTCPLDHILLGFIASRRALAARGAPMDEVLGPDQPCPQDLLSPGAMPTAHAISRVMGELLATFPHVKLPEKMAFMYLMHHTTRVRQPHR